MEKDFNYIKLTPFKWFVLENFPFIEADFDALTEWQLFQKLGREMNKIINSENTLGNQVVNLTNAFNNLQDYVNNYFNNLDVQEEINNKLNEMATDGTLAEIVTSYLQVNGILAYNTVAKMKEATNLIEGSFCKTYGFYEQNDGGGAFYKIRSITNQDVINNLDLIALQNATLVAELVNSQIVNVKQYGAKGNNVNDDIDSIQLAVSKNGGKTIFLPSGIYLISKPIDILANNTKLVGEGYQGTQIKKTTTNASNYQRTYNETVFDYTEYPSIINLIFSDNTNISNITIENILLYGNNKTNYGIIAPHMSFSKFSDLRIQGTITAIELGGWINKIEKCTFLTNSTILYTIDETIATLISNCHSNSRKIYNKEF